jgi:hypothetical protein
MRNDLALQAARVLTEPDRLLDAICLLGDRLAEYRDAGLDLPILWPAMGVDSAREVIARFRQ